MTIFLTLAIYSVRIASDFPVQGFYIPIISIYFIMGLLITFLSLVWFAYAEYIRAKKQMPKMLIKLARLLTCLPLISWLNSKRKKKIFAKPDVESLDKPIDVAYHVTILNYFIFSIMLLISLITNFVIWYLMFTNNYNS